MQKMLLQLQVFHYFIISFPKAFLISSLLTYSVSLQKIEDPQHKAFNFGSAK